MPTIQELRESRGVIGKEIRRMADTLTGEKRDFDSTEKGSWDKANKDFDDIGRQIETMERAAKVEKDLAGNAPENVRPGDEDFGKNHKRAGSIDADKRAEQTAVALRAWARRGAGHDVSDAELRACRAAGVNPNAIGFDIPMFSTAELRASQSTSGSAGGYAIPQGFMANLERALKSFGVVRTVADIMRTDTGNTLPWPTVNDSATSGRMLAENTAVTETAVTLGQTSFAAYKMSSDLLTVSNELMNDSAFDLAAELGSLLGERLGRISNTYQTTGTGSSQPGGVVTGSTLGKTAAGATAIVSDELIDLYHSVDPAYRSNPGVGFMMHDGILAVVRKLKDSQNRYLWEPGYQAGVPETLLGKPVYVNQDMQATVATATKTVLFGDFKKFKIREVNGIRLMRMDERYGDLDQVGFVAFLRFDSKVLNAGTNPLKHLVQA